MTTQAPQFAGQWEKVTRSACGQKYPETIQFQAAGSFVGRSDPPGTYAHWDVGSFEVVDPAHVRISIANDALVTYEFRSRGVLTQGPGWV
jgi:hypothetical protein